MPTAITGPDHDRPTASVARPRHARAGGAPASGAPGPARRGKEPPRTRRGGARGAAAAGNAEPRPAPRAGPSAVEEGARPLSRDKGGGRPSTGRGGRKVRARGRGQSPAAMPEPSAVEDDTQPRGGPPSSAQGGRKLRPRGRGRSPAATPEDEGVGSSWVRAQEPDRRAPDGPVPKRPLKSVAILNSNVQTWFKQV